MHLMYAHILCCTSLHLKISLSSVLDLILAIFVLYREWVNLVIVSALHLVQWTSFTLLTAIYCFPSSDQQTYVSRFGQKRLLNALNVNVNVNLV